MYYLFILALGLSVLILGAELLIRKSYVIAHRLKVKPILIGILLLGMGTSAPEWAVSTLSALKGSSSLAMGNVIGSNIFNILVVLSFIMLNPVSHISHKLIRKDILFLVLGSICLIPFLSDYFLSRGEAIIMSIGFIAYIIMSICYSSQENTSTVSPVKETILKTTLLSILGFICLTGGAYITVYSAEHLGHSIGLSNRLIGILIASVGTSLPELLICLSAIFKGDKDMAIGNIIGSNIFNTFAILSTSSLILPAVIEPQTLSIDLPVLLLTNTFILILIFKNFYNKVRVILPIVLLTGYCSYVLYLITN